MRAQIQTLKAEKNDVELRLCENEEHSRQVDLKREAAERRCADISTQFRQFRQDNDLQLVNLSSANEELKSKLKQAESEIHRQAAEFDSTVSFSVKSVNTSYALTLLCSMLSF